MTSTCDRFGLLVGQRDGPALIGCNILRSLCGPAWIASEVFLAHHRPRDIRPYRQFFGAPVRFDAGHNTLVVPDQVSRFTPWRCLLEQ